MKRRDSNCQYLSLKTNSSNIKTNIFKSCQTAKTHMSQKYLSVTIELKSWTHGVPKPSSLEGFSDKIRQVTLGSENQVRQKDEILDK